MKHYFACKCRRLVLSVAAIAITTSTLAAQEIGLLEEPVAEEKATGGWLWGDWFGQDEELVEQVPADLGSESSSEEEQEQTSSSWMITSPLANISWPEIKLPNVEFRAPWMASEGEKEGGWITAPIARARSATRGAMQRTRTAWNSTIDRMKFVLPGSTPTEPTAIAEAGTKPGFWQRWFGPEVEPAGPNSVGDLMAKESDPADPSYRR